MDVCAFGSRMSAQKNSIFLRSERRGELKFLGRDVHPYIRPDVRGISRPKTLCLGCFSVPEKLTLGNVRGRQWQLLPSSLGALDATAKVPFLGGNLGPEKKTFSAPAPRQTPCRPLCPLPKQKKHKKYPKCPPSFPQGETRSWWSFGPEKNI